MTKENIIAALVGITFFCIIVIPLLFFTGYLDFGADEKTLQTAKINYIDPASISIQSPASVMPTQAPTITPAATFTPTPTPAAKTWHSLITFTGSADKTTRPFTIKGDEWQIKYSVKAESGKTEYSVFYGYAYPRGETAMYVTSWDCYEKSCSDTQYIYKGNGDYYIKVSSCFNNWKLEVEDYY